MYMFGHSKQKDAKQISDDADYSKETEKNPKGSSFKHEWPSGRIVLFCADSEALIITQEIKDF